MKPVFETTGTCLILSGSAQKPDDPVPQAV